VSETVETRPAGLRRSLSLWQAVGLSVALMAPSMAANINPQQTASAAGRAVPLAFLLSAVGVLLVAYGFAKLCQYYQHAGSVYAFVGATLGPRAGVVSGIGLLGTYTFFAVTTASAAGVLGTAFLSQVGIWPNAPAWAPWVLTGVALAGAWLLAVVPARRGTSLLLLIEGATIALILLVSAVIAVRLIAGSAPGGARFTLDVFSYTSDAGISGVFTGAVFGFLSFAGFEAAATLGEETHEPRRAIPRVILGTALFGGLYFVVVTAIEMMAFGGDAQAFHDSQSLLGDLGGRFVGSWAGDLISVGAAISAFGCCLACVVGAARLLFALGRDAFGERGIGKTSEQGSPVIAATAVAGTVALSLVLCAVLFNAHAVDTFAWFGAIGTLILLVIYLLTTIGAILLVFVRRRLRVPAWHILFPLGALVLLGYTVYVNVVPYPASGPPQWFPVVAGAVLLLAAGLVLVAPGYARRVAERLT
jgi:amino acid transporter